MPMRIPFTGIQHTKDTCGGKARLKGTRIDVAMILMELQRGQAIEEIAKSYQITEEEVKVAIGYAFKCVTFLDCQD